MMDDRARDTYRVGQERGVSGQQGVAFVADPPLPSPLRRAGVLPIG